MKRKGDGWTGMDLVWVGCHAWCLRYGISLGTARWRHGLALSQESTTHTERLNDLNKTQICLYDKVFILNGKQCGEYPIFNNF